MYTFWSPIRYAPSTNYIHSYNFVVRNQGLWKATAFNIGAAIIKRRGPGNLSHGNFFDFGVKSPFKKRRLGDKNPRVSSIGESGLSASSWCGPSNANPIEQSKGVVRQWYAQRYYESCQTTATSISIPATPSVRAGVVGLHSKYTHSGFGRTITLSWSALARDSPNRSCAYIVVTLERVYTQSYHDTM